jgi:hypothetical protein
VVAKPVAATTATAIRGWNDTTPANVADNSFVSLNPRWTTQQVDHALEETLQDLAAQRLYIPTAGTALTLVAGQNLYEIVETDVDPMKGVLSVYYQEASDARIFGVPFHNLYEPGSTILTTGGYAVRLLDWGNNRAGDDLEVIYAKKVTALADSDNEPLLESALVLGAVARLLAMSEGPRIHDPGRFTDRTVQPGQPLRDAAYFAGQYQRAVWRYRGELQARESNLPGAEWARIRNYKGVGPLRYGR